jgi:hypothetical protein
VRDRSSATSRPRKKQNNVYPEITGRLSPTLRNDTETLTRIQALGALQCATGEIALILGVTEQALDRFFARKAFARLAYDTGRGNGVETLRQAQFKLAQTNASMAAFLGKLYLGQADRREPDQFAAIDVSQAAQRVRDRVAAIAADRGTRGDC